jgi:hypothetical protein
VADTEGASLPLLKADKLVLDDIQLDLPSRRSKRGIAGQTADRGNA